MPNPFQFGTPIKDPAAFIGRNAELRRIFSAIETAHTGQAQHISVVGERRIGKTSLLHQVANTAAARLQIPTAYRFVFVDLDDAHCHTQAGLLQFISSRLRPDTVAPAPQIVPQSSPTLQMAERALANLEKRAAGHSSLALPNELQIELEDKRKEVAALKGLSASPQGIAGLADLADLLASLPFLPVICLDEFEHLVQRREQFPDDFFTALRSLASDGKLALITASKTPLAELFAAGGLTSPFHNIFQLIELGSLTAAESDELVERGLACDRPFTLDDCRQLRQLAEAKPYHLQVAASLLYEAKAEPPVDWKKLATDYHKQVNFALRQPPEKSDFFKKSDFWTSLPRALRAVLTWPRHLGRLIFDGIKYDKASETSTLILGWGLLILVLLVATNPYILPTLIDLVKRGWRFFFPVK